MPKLDRVSGLKDHLGYWLRYVSNQVSAALAARSLEGFDVSVAEWVVLRDLYDQPLASKRFGAAHGHDPRRHLEACRAPSRRKALVTREAAAGDRRFVGAERSRRRLVPELARLADRNDAGCFGELSAAERQTIRVPMEVMVRGRKIDCRGSGLG